jgi:transporter family-2 protein
VLCVPRIGVASFSAAVLVGQLVGAMLLDHMGWMGVIQRQITATRMCGVALLLLGVWLIHRDN